nr:MAG TPA: hypothetical protein [Caudoviricetes sp.]
MIKINISYLLLNIPDDIFDKVYSYLDKDMKRVIKKTLRTKFLNRVIEAY